MLNLVQYDFMAKTKFDRSQTRKRLKANDMRVYELAKACEVRSEYMSQVLTGKKKPSPGLKKLIGYVLDDREAIAKAATKAKAS